MKELKTCITCKNLYPPIKFKTLVSGFPILKCIKCRKYTYKNFLTDNPITINYILEYSLYLRCQQCNNITSGIEDFRDLHSKKILKKCNKCYISKEKIILSKINNVTHADKLSLYKELNKTKDISKFFIGIKKNK